MGDLNKWQKILLWGADHIPNIKFTKDLAYKIISDRQVGYQAGATKQDVIRNLKSDLPKDEDTNKYMFVYGADTRRPETSIGQAYDWADDIKENEYQNVKSYEGILNPYGEYLVDSRNKGLIEALAKAKYSPVSNINNEYIDWDTFRRKKGVPYYDDVHGYRPTFHYDQNGNAVVSSSDLYDFGKNYVGDFTDLYAERSGNENDPAFTMELQRRALNSVGQPYLLVQKNIPIRYVDNPQGDEIWRVNNFNKELRLDEMSDEEIASITKTGYIKPVVVTNKKGGILKYQNSGKIYQKFTPRIYDPNKKLNWSAKDWLEERAENDRGPKYTQKDIRIFNSHVPEYRKIERESRKNGTWLKMPDGSTYNGDPREWVIMQSKAFKENYQENPWYTGQAEWETKVTLPDGSTVDSNKVKRARYHNGEMWFSNDAGYAQYFADIIDSSKLDERYRAGRYYDETIDGLVAPESKINGKVFLSGIPKTGNYRHLDQDHTPDYWMDMPYELTENGIIRTASENIQNTNDYRKGNIKISGEDLKTDDLVNHSRQLGDDGLFIYNVNDGPSIRKRNESKDYKSAIEQGVHEYPWEVNNARPVFVPINEFISQPGFTEKIKFIRGNNGNFDPNTDDKYSAIFNINSPLFAKKGGNIHIKKKNRGKFTEYCGGKVTEECIAKGKKSKNPKIRKRATFATNARKWKHENGGILKAQNSAKLPNGYVRYNGSDLSNIETFNKNWLNYRNSQLANQGWKDENIKNKLNWFQRNFGAFDKTVANLVRKQLFSELDNTKELSFSDALKDSQGRYLLTESMYSDFPGERKLYEVEVGPPKPVEDWKLDYSFNRSVTGTHYPDFDTIIYNDLYQNTPTKIHERDHAMFGLYNDKNIGLKIVDNIFKQEFLDNVVDKWGYYDDPGEIRARLMEMRYNNELDPNHKYTLDEIENMRNDPTFIDSHIFDRYTNKYIEYLLNNVAQNNMNKNRLEYRPPINFAKNGGILKVLDNKKPAY